MQRASFSPTLHIINRDSNRKISIYQIVYNLSDITFSPQMGCKLFLYSFMHVIKLCDNLSLFFYLNCPIVGVIGAFLMKGGEEWCILCSISSSYNFQVFYASVVDRVGMTHTKPHCRNEKMSVSSLCSLSIL